MSKCLNAVTGVFWVIIFFMQKVVDMIEIERDRNNERKFPSLQSFEDAWYDLMEFGSGMKDFICLRCRNRSVLRYWDRMAGWGNFLDWWRRDK
jgi:hypothetical protein